MTYSPGGKGKGKGRSSTAEAVDLAEYHEFLHSKIRRVDAVGFEANSHTLPRDLFAFQNTVVRWACMRGRAAIFAGCGLGKTLMQLAWAQQVIEHTGGPVLILTPLAVAPQTVAEAMKFGIVAEISENTFQPAKPACIQVANYEKFLAGRFDPDAYAGIVLDESSILKSYMGKTKRSLIEGFARTPYRLCCTATPAPNDYLELGNHAEKLGIMPSNEMIARWFIADQSSVGKYKLMGHAEADFWRWVASWAVCLDKPSDLGEEYSDEGFVLPELRITEHVADAGLATRVITEECGQRLLVPVEKLTATSMHAEMRQTAASRAQVVADLIAKGDESGEPWLIWCNTDYEADELMIRIPLAVEVRGSEADHRKEAKLMGFVHGAHRILITKPRIAGFGMNLQCCRNVAFVGLSYSHEQFYQAIRRCWRFGQTRPVNCHVVIAETEGEVLEAIKRKEQEHIAMRAAMLRASREVFHENMEGGLKLEPVEHTVEQGKRWTLHHGDCVEVAKTLPSESVDFTIFSPPFAGLYIYSDSLADLGNSESNDEFFQHFRFLVPELLRVTVPGRLCAVHCKDLPRYAGRDGMAGLIDFPGEIVHLFEACGWSYHSRVTIWKCPVVERERTNNNGLLHKTVLRDSSQIRQGMADWLLVFRRPCRDEDGLMSAKPIFREPQGGFTRWIGDPEFDPRKEGKKPHPSKYARRKKLTNDSIALWQRYADPVWFDIDQQDVLNVRLARGDKDEKHICPLQLGLIRRALYLWSDEGDVVFSPFAGVGSEGYVALQEGRKFVGVELKASYARVAKRFLDEAESAGRQLEIPFVDDRIK